VHVFWVAQPAYGYSAIAGHGGPGVPVDVFIAVHGVDGTVARCVIATV
jgi:hypothetical protein